MRKQHFMADNTPGVQTTTEVAGIVTASVIELIPCRTQAVVDAVRAGRCRHKQEQQVACTWVMSNSSLCKQVFSVCGEESDISRLPHTSAVCEMDMSNSSLFGHASAVCV